MTKDSDGRGGGGGNGKGGGGGAGGGGFDGARGGGKKAGAGDEVSTRLGKILVVACHDAATVCVCTYIEHRIFAASESFVVRL